MKRNKGFTLIELLAVIVILGILLSISTVAVNTLRKKQEVTNKLNVISSILTGAKEYNAEKRKAPVLVKDLKVGDYVDFDENKYPELLNLDVKKTACGLKSKFSLEYNGVEFNDCGCEEQNEHVIENKKVESFKLCSNSNDISGWDSSGNYYKCILDNKGDNDNTNDVYKCIGDSNKNISELFK